MIILVYVYLFRHFFFFYFHCFFQSTNKFFFFPFCYSSPPSKPAFHPLMVSLKRQLRGRRSQADRSTKSEAACTGQGVLAQSRARGRGAWMLSEALVSDWSASCPVRGRLSPGVERLEVERRNLVWTLVQGSPGRHVTGGGGDEDDFPRSRSPGPLPGRWMDRLVTRTLLSHRFPQVPTSTHSSNFCQNR